MMCIARISPMLENINCIHFCEDDACQRLIERNCPPLIYLPDVPVLFGHVYLVYTTDYGVYSATARLPRYVCYNEQFCPDLPTNIVLPTLHNATCRLFRDLPDFEDDFYPLSTWPRVVQRLHKVFWACRSIINDSSLFSNTSIMYRCNNMSKYISRNRINDEIRDCFDGDDEYQFMTTEQMDSLKPKQNWHKCESGNISIASHLVDRKHFYLVNMCDRYRSSFYRYIKTHISFQTICDGFTELKPININGQDQTDETECEQWQCNNTYTRCDGIWNCLNGADEIKCNPSSLYNCTPDEHLCVSPINNQFMCIPFAKAHDGIVDCLGGTDEIQLCQTERSIDIVRDKFYCKSIRSTYCISHSLLCDQKIDCLDGSDEQFCKKNLSGRVPSLCSNENALIRTDIDNYLCNYFSYHKSSRIYFSTDQVNKSIKYLDTHPVKNSSILVNSTRIGIVGQQQQRRCHRGLDMHVRLNIEKNLMIDACLCSPTYYGDTCQYQNQRVTLTVKLNAASDSWSTPFAIVVSLADDERSLRSHEQINQFTYLYIRDCQIKIHFYLLYATRPKNKTKPYHVHIDAYEKKSLAYRASWRIPVTFSFLPVHRMTIQLTIPSVGNGSKSCSDSQCIHGQCTTYVDDTNATFCRCSKDWSGRDCTIPHTCTCSDDSLCVGLLANNRSLCVCPLGKFGSRCLLDQLVCQSNTCQNGGQYMPIDEYIPSRNKFI
jgi:hypothetical protein